MEEMNLFNILLIVALIAVTIFSIRLAIDAFGPKKKKPKKKRRRKYSEYIQAAWDEVEKM